jgi:23S rRNA (cytidine1920-2'-O)/16S rRNA (cytidine1409-2'-O)-methyltransferase
MRLDQALVQRGLIESREKAQRAVLAGTVRVNGEPAGKPGDKTKDSDLLELTEREKFVSRGGHKLEHALQHFSVDVAGLTAMDLGASTGGFTDCLLQRGAAKVFAIDVGQGQLAWSLRQDPRVVVMERTNARSLTPAAFPQPFIPADLVVADCSFISLTKILPAAAGLVKRSGRIVALIKPQFEAGRLEVSKGAGVITDPTIHERVVAELRHFAESGLGFRWVGVTDSPLLGPAGNKEFLALLETAA